MVNQLSDKDSCPERPPGAEDLSSTRHPSVPLQPATPGATMPSGARIFRQPGKQLRSTRCLREVSGHRYGNSSTPSGLQVVPGSTVLT